jgi:hypothetical protein
VGYLRKERGDIRPLVFDQLQISNTGDYKITAIEQYRIRGALFEDLTVVLKNPVRKSTVRAGCA